MPSLDGMKALKAVDYYLIINLKLNMKKIAFLLLLSCTSVHSEKPSLTPLEYAQDYCKTSQGIAYIAQSNRQDGKKASETIDELTKLTDSIDIKELKEQQQKMLLMIVQNAYKQPVYATHKEKSEVISTFEEFIYLACMESFNKKEEPIPAYTPMSE